MNKKIVISVILLAALISIPLVKKYKYTKPQTPLAARAEAWAVFQNYLTAAKNHDVKTLSGLLYKLSSVCTDSARVSECNARMDKAYEIGSTLKEEDFSNILSDSKQTILTTEYKPRETDLVKGYERSLIYFARIGGSLKLITFVPQVTTFTMKRDTDKNTEGRLAYIMKDTDGDTIDDEVETCTFVGADPKTCIKTDPNKRDTDGNGWWDPTEAVMKAATSSE